MGIIGLIIFLIGFIKLIFELLNYISKKLISYLGFLGALVAAFINGGSKGYIVNIFTQRPLALFF